MIARSRRRETQRARVSSRDGAVESPRVRQHVPVGIPRYDGERLGRAGVGGQGAETRSARGDLRRPVSDHDGSRRAVREPEVVHDCELDPEGSFPGVCVRCLDPRPEGSVSKGPRVRGDSPVRVRRAGSVERDADYDVDRRRRKLECGPRRRVDRHLVRRIRREALVVNDGQDCGVHAGVRVRVRRHDAAPRRRISEVPRVRNDPPIGIKRSGSVERDRRTGVRRRRTRPEIGDRRPRSRRPGPHDDVMVDGPVQRVVVGDVQGDVVRPGAHIRMGCERLTPERGVSKVPRIVHDTPVGIAGGRCIEGHGRPDHRRVRSHRERGNRRRMNDDVPIGGRSERFVVGDREGHVECAVRRV